jgi:hypothetical protein
MLTMRLAVLLALISAWCTAAAQVTTGPAPAGDAARVALQMLREAEHPCPKITKATRGREGDIYAMCSNGEDYRLFTVTTRERGTKPLAMRCSAARKLGVDCR